MSLTDKEKLNSLAGLLEVKKSDTKYFLARKLENGVMGIDNDSFDFAVNCLTSENLNFSNITNVLGQIFNYQTPKTAEAMLISSKVIETGYSDSFPGTFYNEGVFNRIKSLIPPTTSLEIKRLKSQDEAKNEIDAFSSFILSLPPHFGEILANTKNLKIKVENTYPDACDYVYFNTEKQKIISGYEDVNRSIFRKEMPTLSVGQNLQLMGLSYHDIIHIKRLSDIENLSHELGHYFASVLSTTNAGFISPDSDLFWKTVTKSFIDKNPNHEISQMLNVDYPPDLHTSEIAAYMFQKLLPKFAELKDEKQAIGEMRQTYKHLFSAFEVCYLDPLKKITVNNIREYEGYQMPLKRIQQLEQAHKIEFSFSTKEKLIENYRM